MIGVGMTLVCIAAEYVIGIGVGLLLYHIKGDI